MTGAKVGKIIAYILLVLVLVSAIGFIAYFTGGFTSGFKTFYVEIDGDQILTSESGYKIPTGEAMTVEVKYTMSDEKSGYSVKVVPNKLAGKDFDFTLDGEVYSYHGEKDLTEGFEIEYGDTSFTIKPKGTITDILRAVYPGSAVEDCRDFAYDNMFTLIVTSHDGESNVKVNFTVSEDTEGITITPDHIYF